MEMILCLDCGDMYKNNGNNNHECVVCHSNNVKNVKDLNFTIDDYFEIMKISEDGNFIYEMLKLKTNNPIEYQLKLQQLQSTTKQPTCPFCKSNNVKKISGSSKAVSVALWGLFSQKVKKQWHCNNCNSDF